MNEETIFQAALTKSSSKERSEFLDQACAGDPQLRASVEQLIRAHESASDFLETPVLARSGESPDGLSAHVSTNSASSTEMDGRLNFLEPSDEPGIIGKLGSYHISETVGRGGMGIVLRGHDTRLNRVVAIKVLAPELASNIIARRRFLREAQAAAAVSHTHVVTTHAIDERENFPYIVMEYISGCSLQERIDRDGPLDVKRILRIARQTALGLAAAHEQGLIHRDIKPANILLENGVERVKLSDFGLARAIDDVSTTQTGMVAGTPQYMSPEQAQGQRVDHRSDLFSLGCVMYAMCTGRSPFRAETAVAALRRVCDDRPRPIEEINPDIPDWLIAIINRLLRKHPEDRYQSAAEVADLLGKGLAHLQHPSGEFQVELAKLAEDASRINASAVAPTVAEQMNGVRSAIPSHRPAERRHSRQTALVVATILGLLCLTVGVTKATGVSNVGEFLATILRIGTPHGTLTVEVDDPGVEVTIDGEDLVITGAGPQEVRLKPGIYRLLARKDGKLVSQELVTISRDGKQVVKIGFEPGADQRSDRFASGQNVSLPEYRFEEVAHFRGQHNVQYAAHFSPNGEAILTYTSADAGAQIRRIPDGKELKQFPGEFGAAAWLPDRKGVVTGSHQQENKQNALIVWNAETGRPLWSSPQVTGAFQALDISNDGRLVVSGHGQWWGGHHDRDQAVRIWDLKKRELLHEMQGHTDQVMAVAMAPDGTSVVSGSRDRTVRLWDTKTGNEIRQFEGLGTQVFSVAFSPDGRFVLAGYGPHEETGIQDRLINDPQHCVAVLWEKDTGKEVQRFVGHSGCINSVGFSPDGNLIVTASGEAYIGEPLPDGSSKKTRDNTVRLWERTTGEQLASLEHRTSPKSASFSPDGKFLVTGEWLLVHLWRVPEALYSPAVAEAPKAISHPLLVSSNRDGNFEIYRIDPPNNRNAADGGENWINLTNHPAEDSGPAWSPDGTQIAFCSSRSGNLDIWLMDAEGNVTQLTDFAGIDRTPCWSPDGKRIAFVRHLSATNWEIFVMDADGSNEVNLTNHPAKEADPAWSPDGKSIAYSFDNDGTRLYLMDADGTNPRVLSSRRGSFTFPAWSPDGSQLVYTGWADEVGGDLELFLINADGSQDRQLTEMKGLNTFAAWSPDGKTIAFEHRHPNAPGRKATVYCINADGSDGTAISGAEAHVGYGGGRPAWQPNPPRGKPDKSTQ